MARSPSISSPHPPNSISNSSSNLNSVVIFSSGPLDEHKAEHLQAARTKRRRQQRAFRMSREKEIPALTRRCVTLGNITASCFSEKPCCPANEVKHEHFEGGLWHFCAQATSSGGHPNGAIAPYDGQMHKSNLSPESYASSECSGGEGDVSDVGNDRRADLAELGNWRSSLSSSLCSSAHESPLNVSKAASDCSNEDPPNAARTAIAPPANAFTAEYGYPLSSCVNETLDDKNDSLSAEYWKLQADVLAAECRLLRLEKELSLRKWKQECEEMNGNHTSKEASRGTSEHYIQDVQFKQAFQNASKRLHEMSYVSHCFNQEALRRLQILSYHKPGRKPLEDPAESLQEKLQGLFLSPQTPAARRDTCQKPLDCVSSEVLHSECQGAVANVRQEHQSMPSEKKQLDSERIDNQISEEEMSCKAAIRQIVALVQAENEQWSQVQEILCTLQEEMDVLIETRDLSERRAAQAEAQVFSLKNMLQEWRCRAWSTQEKVTMLQSERQDLKAKLQSLKQKYAAERRKWSDNGKAHREAAALPSLPTRSVVVTAPHDVEELPRLANVGTQEDYALCESIIHSRNESSRSSVDLGASFQRSDQRSIKKSLDFSNNSYDSNRSKCSVQSQCFTDQIIKIEPAQANFCIKTSDITNHVSRHDRSGNQQNVQFIRLECREQAHANECKERKKARLFMSKENYSISAPLETYFPLHGEHLLQRHSLGDGFSATQDLLDQVMLSKSPSPSAPTSTPSRLPFGEIFNSPSSH